MTFEAGQRVGDFELYEAAGRGGMAEVWRGRHATTGEQVALKRLLSASSAAERQRLEREARALQLIEHENVVGCHAFGYHDDAPYLVLEWLAGEDLAQRLRRGYLPLGEAIAVIDQILAGLAACHDAGVVHRDLKPANVYVVGDDPEGSSGAGASRQVKLVDFGLALLTDATRMTAAGTVMGTLYYMSPEQAYGQSDIEPAADIYAVGVMLYQLCTGALPFVASQPAALLLKIVTETPQRPSELRGDLPEALDALILRAMARDPAERFTSAAEMRAALHRCADVCSALPAPRVAPVAPGPGAEGGDDATEAFAEPSPMVRAATGVQQPEAASERREVRVVWLVCAEPVERRDRAVSDAARVAVLEHGGSYEQLMDAAIGIFGLKRTAGDEAQRAVKAGLSLLARVGPRARALASLARIDVDARAAAAAAAAAAAVAAAAEARTSASLGAGLLGDASDAFDATMASEQIGGLRWRSEDLDRITAHVAEVPPGQLAVDAATQQTLGARLDAAPLEAPSLATFQRVKGLGEASGRRRVLGVETRLWGRKRELAALRASVDEAFDAEQAEAVLLVGPQGIGKSRLLEELVPEAAEQSVLLLRAGGDSARAERPYGLLDAALRTLAGIHVGDSAQSMRAALARAVGERVRDSAKAVDVATFLAEAIGLDGSGDGPSNTDDAALKAARRDPQLMRERVGAAFEALIAGAADAGPVALVLDDLQWADDATLALLRRALAVSDEQPLALVATSRPEALPRLREALGAEAQRRHHGRERPGVELAEIELAPLSKRQIGRLVRAVLGDESDPLLQELVVERCHGNPFFAEELMSYLAARGLIARSAEQTGAAPAAVPGWRVVGELSEAALPAGVEAAVQGRLDTLDSALKALLKGASVLGEVVWDSGCRALGFRHAARGLAELERAEFLEHDDDSRVEGSQQWTFRQVLLQQVAYRMVPDAARAELHRKAALWLDTAGEPDQTLLAYHYERGGEPSRAARCYDGAARHALGSGQLEHALYCFERALALSPPPTGAGGAAARRVERELGVCTSRYRLGELDAARSQVEPLLARELSPLQAAEARLLAGRIALGSGLLDDVEAHLEVAARAVAATERVRAVAAATGALPVVTADTLGDATGIEPTLYASSAGGDASSADAIGADPTLYASSAGGDASSADAEPTAQALSSADRDTRDALAFDIAHTRFWAAWVRGRYAEAGERAAELERSAVAPEQRSASALASAYVQIMVGDLSVALQLGVSAVDDARAVGHPYREIDALLVLGAVQELVGRYRDAARSLAEATERVARLGTAHGPALAIGGGRIALARGDAQQALERFVGARADADARGDARTATQARIGEARALEARAGDGDLARALSLAEEAVAAARDGAMAPVEVEALAVLARLQLACGDTAAAAESARAALACLGALGLQERDESDVGLIAYEALLAAGDPEGARAALARAASAFHAREARIAEPAVRDSYRATAANAALVARLEADGIHV